MLNWTVWNRIILRFNWTVLTFNCKRKLYFYQTELFEILFGIEWPEKGWYALKQPTNQSNIENDFWNGFYPLYYYPWKNSGIF